MKNLEEVREYMYHDAFAVECASAVIDEVTEEEAVCSMVLQPKHLNSENRPMGGALYTLADFAIAAHMYAHGLQGTAVNCSMEYINRAKGSLIIARAHCDKVGSRVVFGTVDVFDDTGRLLAKMQAQLMRFEASEQVNRQQ